MPRKIRPVLERFDEKVDRTGGPDACWPWTKARNERGYGIFRVNGRNERAHRVALIRDGDDPGSDVKVLHSCDNPPCCNPRHLSFGTTADNMADAMSRDRHKRGERGAVKLSDKSVLSIREQVSSGARHAEVADDHGISVAMVSFIATGKRWSHVAGPITSGINKSHCINGHEYTAENTLLRNHGRKKVCRRCNQVAQAKYRTNKEK